MGAWGDGAFQNDAALDWLSEVETDGVEGLRAWLHFLTEPHEIPRTPYA
jgi:hypothetical protein